MKSPRHLLIALTLAVCPAAFSADSLHTFTDAKGRSLRASLVSLEGNVATLKLENGQVFTVGIATLSAADQQWLKAQGTGAVSPLSGSPKPPGGMVFAANWLPKALTARRELLESLEFYCKAAIGDTPRGQETIPTTICGAVRWRMPIDAFIQTLPRGYNKLSERPLVHSCLPNDSLTICGFQFKSFLDHGQPFNQMLLLIDKERCIVSVQFVDQNGRYIRWLPQPDGIREPYYNFISLTYNGSTQREVPYQLLRDRGFPLCVKTAFRDRVSGPGAVPGLPNMPVTPYGRTYENVHWYLPAPFARTILDIVDVYRKAGVIR